jgi:hypothetical protein
MTKDIYNVTSLNTLKNKGAIAMKKRGFIVCISILATLVLVVGSIKAGITHQNNLQNASVQTSSISFEFSQPTLQTTASELAIQLPEATGFRNIAGEPILPIVMHTIELPFGSTIQAMDCRITNQPDLHLTQTIQPAAQPVPLLSDTTPVQPTENTEIYTTDAYFPQTWYSYRITGGLNTQDIETTFLTIQINPVRYNPVQNTIQTLASISIDITYTPPTQKSPSFTDAYDMIIICKDSYARLLEPLVTHKNAHGIQTKLIPVSDIYTGTYFPAEGTDKQEQIKYFIKNAKESWNITYVMLVGNYAQIPARYANLETDTGGLYEELRFVSDLYYADLYTGNGSFCSWDSDNDGLYAEWPYPEGHPQEDIVDLVPDVHVARLACMFKSEVRTMVDKIITYETTAAGSDWFNRMVVIGGDTFDKSIEGGTDYNEGEEATAQALTYMPQFIPVKLWTSLGNLSLDTIETEIGKGCGFLYFCGHGSPKSWATHNNGDYHNWTGMFKNTYMPDLTNKDKSPVLIVGGCHNSEFDTAPKNLILGFLKEGFDYFQVNETWFGSYYKYNYALECWSWVFVKVKGGAIASTGSSGFGGVQVGDYNHDSIPDCIQGLDGWFETEFFRLYNQENLTILGQTYDQVLTGYVQNFPVDTYRYDAKILETHILLGDPSLQIGGYE